MKTQNYSYVPRFYKESKREDGVGKNISDGSVLFYGQYVEVNKFAKSVEKIENKDRSPLTSNWTWKSGDELPVTAMVQADQKTWWYLIYSGGYAGSGYWTSDLAGMLCGNVLSVERTGTLSTTLGMSEIYQTSPIQFVERQVQGAAPISVAVSVRKVTGATASLEINAMRNGRALFSQVETVDLVGGDFSVASIKFATERKAGETFLKSVAVPEQIGLWLHMDLKVKDRR